MNDLDFANQWIRSQCMLLLVFSVIISSSKVVKAQSVESPIATSIGATSQSSDSLVKRPIRIERNVVFSEVAGEKIQADLYRTDDTTVVPMVVMIHGGGWISGDKWNVADHAVEMARAGYLVMAINYRLSPKHKWPAHLDDCRTAIQWLVDHSDKWHGDASRIGAWGYSAGGHLALMLAVDPGPRQPKLKAVVAGGPPCDLSFVPEKSDVLSGIMGGPRCDFPAVYKLASPITHIDKDSPPFFIFHGKDDYIVPFDNSYSFFKAASNLNVRCEFHTVERLGHLLTFIDRESRNKAIAFLDQYLKSANESLEMKKDSSTAVAK